MNDELVENAEPALLEPDPPLRVDPRRVAVETFRQAAQARAQSRTAGRTAIVWPLLGHRP